MEISFKKILIPVDVSESSKSALELGLNIAGRFNSSIHLINVKEKRSILFGNNLNSEIDELIDKNIKELIQEKESSTGLKIDFIKREGSVRGEIIKEADKLNADIIIMGTHGVRGAEEFWIGSNAYKVASSANCPVLTVQESFKRREIKNIVLPIDNTLETRQKVPHAMALARLFGATIHVFGVCSSNDSFTVNHVKSYVNQVKNHLEENQVKNTAQMRSGRNISDLTIEFANEIDADLIIIMTDQDINAIEFFMGPFAQQMVNHSPIPVLSVGPIKEMMVAQDQMNTWEI